MRIIRSRAAAAKTTVVLLILVACSAVIVPTGIWLVSTSLNTNPPAKPTPSPTPSPTPILTLYPTASPTPLPSSTSNPPSPSPLTPSPFATQTPMPTISAPEPTSTPSPAPTPQPSPSPSPTPTHPLPGAGPSTTETLTTDSVSSVQSLLDGLSYLEKSDFSVNANATMGNWSAYVVYAPLAWTPSTKVSLDVSVAISKEVTSEFRAYNKRIDSACILVTAERDFDAQGNERTPWDNTFSTILTPAGLPIEGGGSATISRYNGYTQRGPVDVMIEEPFANFVTSNTTGATSGSLTGSFNLPNNLPPGSYRLRFDFGLKSASRYIDFNNNTIGTRPQDLNSASCAYSPPFAASGWTIDAVWKDAQQITRKPYWVLLWDYNSNGYRGVVAQEDQSRVAISPRNMIHDDMVLPKVDAKGNALSYSLEPNFLLRNDNTQRNIPLNYKSGQWTVKVTLPNGTRLNLGTANFTTRRGNGATTGNASFTSWKPPVYGNYTVEAYGWILDVWGNRYEGGGNYTFWIANRLTIATATFQGMPYNVGNRYGRDTAFNPPVPANVTMKAQLFVNSDPTNVVTAVSNGTATMGGVWGVAQGMIPLVFTAPGEYFATVTATYWDSQGALWVAAMTHAGVVYPTNSSIVAHGKKLTLPNGTLVDRGETHLEGYVEPSGALHLQHINFPYNWGDVLLIASEHQGANKIEPVLTYAVNGTNPTYSSALQSIGHTNIVTKTSNGLAPEMFPEYITDLQYYYGAAAEPGFNARFLVAYDFTRAPYWPTSSNNFGGQYGASNNGDLPGTIYRLLGGVVLRNRAQSPAYAGYQATSIILPGGTNNNRIVGPGDEDLPSPDNTGARFFLVPIRPGSIYPLGATFIAVLQIDPIVPCNVTFTMTAPDSTTRVVTGVGDQYGYFAASKGWPLDQAGVWTYKANATWAGYQGKVPGLPDTGGWIYVIESGPAPGPGITLTIPPVQTFSATTGLNVTGQTNASKVYYATIIPGAVLEQGTLTTINGTFTYNFNPQKMTSKIQTYDIINVVNGKPEIGKIVHLTFFSEEKAANGTIYHSFVRVVLRGTTAVYVKER